MFVCFLLFLCRIAPIVPLLYLRSHSAPELRPQTLGGSSANSPLYTEVSAVQCRRRQHQ